MEGVTRACQYVCIACVHVRRYRGRRAYVRALVDLCVCIRTLLLALPHLCLLCKLHLCPGSRESMVDALC